MISPLAKGCAVSALVLAVGLMINGARAESYGSDAPNAGMSQATSKAKPKPDRVRVTNKQFVVHPQVSTSKKSGK